MLINYGLLSHYESLACLRSLPHHYTRLSCSQSPYEPGEDERESGIPIPTCEPANHRQFSVRPGSSELSAVSLGPVQPDLTQPGLAGCRSSCQAISASHYSPRVDSELPCDKHHSHGVTAAGADWADLLRALQSAELGVALTTLLYPVSQFIAGTERLADGYRRVSRSTVITFPGRGAATR